MANTILILSLVISLCLACCLGCSGTNAPDLETSNNLSEIADVTLENDELVRDIDEISDSVAVGVSPEVVVAEVPGDPLEVSKDNGFDVLRDTGDDSTLDGDTPGSDNGFDILRDSAPDHSDDFTTDQTVE